LGDAYARLQKQHDAVTMYLRVLEAAPESPEAERASCGLRGLTPVLEDLAALQSLADEANDPAVREMAGRRLAERSVDFDRLEDGATYLRTYPEGAAAPAVRERLDQLADKLLSEILLYQRIGDHGKAVDRIHQV